MRSITPLSGGRRSRRPALAPGWCIAAVAALVLAAPARADDPRWQTIFDGRTLEGWEGSREMFRVEGGAIVGGTMGARIPRNEFLCTVADYEDFVLRLDFRLEGRGANAGVQIRSTRIPNDHEVIGYQADLGEPNWWGALYDESRRNRVLAQPDSAALAPRLDRAGWNQYAIYANGRRIRLFINGHLTVDYTEPDPGIQQRGKICLQIHSGPPSQAWYRKIEIKRLDRKPEAPVAAPSETVRFRKQVVRRDFVSEGVDAADVDRDGDLDLLAGAYWFEAPRWTAHEIRTPQRFSVHAGYSDSFLGFAMDASGDGWPDLVQFDFPGKGAYWYQNPGRAGGHWRRRTAHPAVASESPRREDVDGDGSPDLLFVDARTGRPVRLQAPARGDTVWRQHEIGTADPAERGSNRAHGLGFDDLDGDGRRDVLVTDGWWGAPRSRGGAWRYQAADLGEPAAQMYALDADGDGDRDVVSSSAHAYGLWWHEQRRDAEGRTTWRHHTIDDRVSQTHALAVADLNGDRVPDLVTGKRFFAHNGNDPGEFEPSVLLWYAGGRDARGAPTWTPYLIDADAGVGLQILVRDVTGDGRADIVTASKKGVFLFERLR